jgi:uncharacterized protein YggE
MEPPMGKSPAFALMFVLAALTPALAQAPRTLTMAGSATVKAAPDMADISAGVTTEAPTAAAALSANSAAMTRLFAALDRAGVARRNIQTSSFNVSPVYSSLASSTSQQQRLTGYRVSNELHVILEDTAKVGATLDALVAAGANQTNGLSFTIKDPAPLLAKARAGAVADARLRAQQYAAAAGLTLGPIQSVSEGGGEPPRPMYRVMAMAAPTPIAVGEESVSANVTIVWEIH